MARRGENIRKRSDGRWEGRYIKGRSADGKPCWGYVYGATYTEVREISARKKAEYGIYNLNSTDITFSEISEQWLYSVRQGVKESTFAHYQYTLRHYLQPVFGDFKVSALSEKILEQGLLAVITPVNGLQKPLGATMAQECLSMLRRICKYTGLRFLRFVLYTASNPVCAAPGQRTPGGASDLQSSSQGLPDCSQRPLRVPECPQRQLHAEHVLPNYESHRLSHHISDKCCNNKRSDPEHCYVCACAQP